MPKWKWVNRQIDTIIRSSMAGRHERLIPQPPCLAAGSTHTPRSFIHTHTRTSTYQYYMSEGQEAGDCSWHFTSLRKPLFTFIFSHWSSCQFLPTSFILITLSAITFLFIIFQPSVSAPIKWLEVVKLWAGLYDRASRENLSLAL